MINADLSKRDHSSASFIGQNEIYHNTTSAAYSAFYETCLKKQLNNIQINQMASKKLHRLFGLFSDVDFYSPQAVLKHNMYKVIAAKKVKGEHIDNLLLSLHKAHIRSRNIEQAQTLEKKHAHIAFSETYSLTNNIKGDKSFLILNSEKQSLKRVPFAFPNGGFVVVASLPLCSPSNRFVSWLNEAKNKKIKSQFTSNSLFLTPQASSLYIDEMVAANKAMAPLSMVYSFKQNEWPSITSWNTPTFYFYYNGELKSQLIGWPKEGREKELVSLLKAVNL